MSARDALPTGLALGARHLPAARVRQVAGLLVTLAVLGVVYYKR